MTNTENEYSMRFLYDQRLTKIYMHCSRLYCLCPSRLRCPRLWHRTIAGKFTCGGSVAFPWEARKHYIQHYIQQH